MPARFQIYLPLLLALSCLWIATASAQTAAEDGEDKRGPVYVAVASNFVPTARALLKAYAHPDIQLVSGSSGKLYAQIINGAPFHIFLSADQDKPAALKPPQAQPASRFTYAIGTLALWLPEAEAVDQPLSQATFRDLGLKRVAMANPRVAPYGKASVETLHTLNLLHTPSHWVQGENISQAFQFVASGNISAGFIATSQIGSGLQGAVYRVPEAWHEPIKQDAILLPRGIDHPVAVGFYAYLKSAAAKQIIREHGYRTPASDDGMAPL